MPGGRLVWEPYLVEAHEHATRRIRSPNSRALLTRARTLRDHGRDAEAIAVYRTLVKTQGDLTEAWAELGTALAVTGADAQAAACCREALRRDPCNEAATDTLAQVLRRTGNARTAAVFMGRLLCIRPDHHTLPNMSLVLGAAGQRAGALRWARRAAAVWPLSAASWNTLGNAQRASGRFADAILAWSRALVVDPAMANALGNMAGLLRDMEHPALSERALRRSLRIDPGNAGLLNGLVHCLQGQRREAEANAAGRRALALAPAYADAWCNVALFEQNAGRTGRADQLFERVTRIDRRHPLGHFNRGLLALERGDTATGWSGYAHRFASGQARRERRFAAPEWRGEPLTGKRILIWREQGVGDEILFASCYPDIMERAAETVIECEPRLTTLFARSFPGAVVRPERRLPARTVEAADADMQVAAGTLPGYLRRSPSDFPARGRWLTADPERVERRALQLAALGDGLRVGIAWRSNLMTLNRRAAYAPLDQWGAVFRVPGVRFINVQHGPCGDELADTGRRFGITVHGLPDLDLKDDFEETAALLAALDLVIAPAVSVGELAAALGTPVWRFGGADWTQLGTSVRPWFPTMRTFRPGAGARLSDALDSIGRHLALC